MNAIKQRESKKLKRVLSIAGSDPSGGAGIQADIKVLAEMGVYAAGAVTALTRQTTVGVLEVMSLPPEWVGRQVADVLADLRPHGVKTGMLGNAATARAVTGAVREWMAGRGGEGFLVVDPVLASGGGTPLYEPGGLDILTRGLFPLATLVTPNANEAALLTGITVNTLDDAREAAAMIHKYGCRWVLVKGGHLADDPATVTDLLYDGRRFFIFPAPRLEAGPLHGTGCSLASCLAAHLVRGLPMRQAVEQSTAWLRKRIARAARVGKGRSVVCQV